MEFFGQLDDSAKEFLREQDGASWSPRKTSVLGCGNGGMSMSDATAGVAAPAYSPAPQMPTAAPAQIRQATTDSIRAFMLIRNYRVRGHLHANLDPLGLVEPPSHADLEPATYGFSEADMDRPIFINYVLGLETASLRQLVRVLEETYCGNIGVEYMHIQVPEEKSWIQERIEGIRTQRSFTELGRRTILERLTEAETFEKYLDRKHKGTKRFGLDGGEAVVPALLDDIDSAPIDARLRPILRYVRKLTLTPSRLVEADAAVGQIPSFFLEQVFFVGVMEEDGL